MHRLSFTSAGSDAHQRDCDALTARGVTVSFAHAASTARCTARRLDLWCTVRSADDAPVGGAVVRVDRSRKLPWVRLARVEQAGPLLRACAELVPGGVVALVTALRGLLPALGRLTVQCYAPDPNELAQQRAWIEQGPFTLAAPVSYARTLVLPLTANHDALLAQLSSSARRNLRELAASGFEVVPLTDPEVAPQLERLLNAAHSRTGGHASATDWGAMLRATAADPLRSIVLGVRHPGRQATEALVGFAQGTVTDGAVSYAVAGTERAPDIGRTPLSYALLWGLLCWAADRGHAWFDFGGVTPENQPDHPLAGISAFKRRFGGAEREIAHEWRTAPHALSGTLLALAESVLARR